MFWGDVRTSNWLAALVAVGAIWLFTIVNILGVRETGLAQVITTVVKFVPLAVIGIIGLFYIARRELHAVHDRPAAASTGT